MCFRSPDFPFSVLYKTRFVYFRRGTKFISAKTLSSWSSNMTSFKVTFFIKIPFASLSSAIMSYVQVKLLSRLVGFWSVISPCVIVKHKELILSKSKKAMILSTVSFGIASMVWLIVLLNGAN